MTIILDSSSNEVENEKVNMSENVIHATENDSRPFYDMSGESETEDFQDCSESSADTVKIPQSKEITVENTADLECKSGNEDITPDKHCMAVDVAAANADFLVLNIAGVDCATRTSFDFEQGIIASAQNELKQQAKNKPSLWQLKKEIHQDTDNLHGEMKKTMDDPGMSQSRVRESLEKNRIKEVEQRKQIAVLQTSNSESSINENLAVVECKLSIEDKIPDKDSSAIDVAAANAKENVLNAACTDCHATQANYEVEQEMIATAQRELEQQKKINHSLRLFERQIRQYTDKLHGEVMQTMNDLGNTQSNVRDAIEKNHIDVIEQRKQTEALHQEQHLQKIKINQLDADVHCVKNTLDTLCQGVANMRVQFDEICLAKTEQLEPNTNTAVSHSRQICGGDGDAIARAPMEVSGCGTGNDQSQHSRASFNGGNDDAPQIYKNDRTGALDRITACNSDLHELNEIDSRVKSIGGKLNHIRTTLIQDILSDTPKQSNVFNGKSIQISAECSFELHNCLYNIMDSLTNIMHHFVDSCRGGVNEAARRESSSMRVCNQLIQLLKTTKDMENTFTAIVDNL